MLFKKRATIRIQILLFVLVPRIQITTKNHTICIPNLIQTVNCIRSTTISIQILLVVLVLRIQRPIETSVCQMPLHCPYQFYIYVQHCRYNVNAVLPCTYSCIHSLALHIQQICTRTAVPFQKGKLVFYINGQHFQISITKCATTLKIYKNICDRY